MYVWRVKHVLIDPVPEIITHVPLPRKKVLSLSLSLEKSARASLSRKKVLSLSLSKKVLSLSLSFIEITHTAPLHVTARTAKKELELKLINLIKIK